MRWSLLLRLRNRPVKETPEGVAGMLSVAIIEAANRLVTRLEEEGFARVEPERFKSEASLLECVLFEWFLRDVVIPIEFPRHTELIRRLLFGKLLLDLNRSGLSAASLNDFDRIHGERSREYAEACRSSESLQSFGALAWMRILGRDEPSDRGTMFLALRGIGELRALVGMGKGYVVREGRPLLPDER
jgi:hypothetical protein